MMTILTLLILWLVSAPVNYVVVRRDQVAIRGKWTRVDRIVWLAFSIAYGPLMLLAIGCVGLFLMLDRSAWGNAEVKW